MHRLGLALGKFVEEVEDLPHTSLVNWMAFNRLCPFGEDVEDMRFMALRADLNFASASQQYVAGLVAGGKNGTKPQYKQPSAFPIVERHGMKKAKRDFRDMTQQEIADHMNRMFGHASPGN